MTPQGKRPDWLDLPPLYNNVPIAVTVRTGNAPDRAINTMLIIAKPDLLILGWEGGTGHGQYLLGSTLNPVLKRAPCTIMMIRVKARDDGETAEPIEAADKRWQHIVVPAAGGPNAILAIQQALDLGPNTEVTALFIAREAYGNEAIALGHDRLAEILKPWQGNPRIKPKVVQAADIVEGILDEAIHYDLLFLGATEESLVERALFGNIPQRIAAESAVPVIIMQRGKGRVNSLLRWLRWWLFEALPKLTIPERAEVYLSIWRGARPRIDFFVMIGLAAAIAGLGLRLNSAAVIIGAMLVAPLMSAVIGLGLGVVQGDTRLLRVAVRALLRGIGLAVTVGLLVGLLTDIRVPTAEMLARTQPTLIDLAIALLSGAAGAYALSRKGVSTSLPGVAIAAALVPPLTTVGLCLAMGRFYLAGGALLLFVANLVAINAAGALVFLWLGFGPASSDHAERGVLRTGIIGITTLLAAVALILGILTADSMRQSGLNRQIEAALITHIGAMNETALTEWELQDVPGSMLYLEVIVQSTQEISQEEAQALQRQVANEVGQPVALTLSVIPTQRLPPLIPLKPDNPEMEE